MDEPATKNQPLTRSYLALRESRRWSVCCAAMHEPDHGTNEDYWRSWIWIAGGSPDSVRPDPTSIGPDGLLMSTARALSSRTV